MEWLSAPGRLTPTRPNSQARSRGVFPALSTMHGFDWCCSSISDCGRGVPSALGRQARASHARHPRGGPHHIVVTVLGREVEGDVALI